MSLALSIFNATTSAAIESYYPDRYDVLGFFKLTNLWWTTSNSKQRYNRKFRIGDVAVEVDNKPLFLRAFADCLERWQALQGLNSQRFTLTKQTCSALVTTLCCNACLIEDLLSRNYEFVLTSRLQTDPLEHRFSKYRQMSGGRILIGLREMELLERVLLKESVNIFGEDLRKENMDKSLLILVDDKLNALSLDLESFMLNEEGVEVAAVIAGYISKVILDKANVRCVKHCLQQ